VYVGAGYEARDRVVGLAGELVNRYGSRTAVEKEIKRSRRDVESDIKRFERRGNTARNQIERDVRKARARLERELRGRQREAARRRNLVTEGIATVSGRVEETVQFGVATGGRLASVAKDRVAAIA
jgi:predicted  nucleic acid-binding Zn-ribbon protein